MLFKKSVMTAAVFAVGSFAVMSANAAAETAGSTFQVGMTVEKLCTVTKAGNISLNPTAINIAATPQSTTFNVACSKDTPYSITMSPTSGTANSGAGKLTGALHSAEDVRELAYTLSETSGGPVWGSTYKTAVLGAGFVDEPTAYTVFVNLTADSRNAKPDTYTDNVAVSIGY